MITSTTAVLHTEEDLSCIQSKHLLSCAEFNILLERFCNGIMIDKPEYEAFLQRYFNDEGYIDIWRIPHAMVDALQRNTKFNRVFLHKEFRDMFHKFIAELYNFCLRESFVDNLQENGLATDSASGVANHIKTRKLFLDELMNTFVQVLESMEA